jgi:hypothetical protein
MHESEQLLILKGGDNGPKKFDRLPHIDEPVRSLTYMQDGQEYDAIVFTPRKNVKLTGFSVYPALVMGFPCTGELMEEYQCHWTCKVDGNVVKSECSTLTKDDAKKKIVDIVFDEEIPVKAGRPISISVRYTSLEEDAFMCQVLMGYGGEDPGYGTIKSNEKGAFEIHNSDDCSKGETDVEFGNIPRILYFD